MILFQNRAKAQGQIVKFESFPNAGDVRRLVGMAASRI